MKRAFSYLRFSEPRQQWGDSERRQVKLTEDYCTRKGLVLDDSLHLQDRGTSALHSANVETGRLGVFLDEVKRDRVPAGSTLIIENLDRLSRDQTLKALTLFTSILESGIVIVTLSPEREYTYKTANENVGLIMEAILSLFLGHEESRKKSARVKEEWSERLKNVAVEKMTARCPAWLRLRPDRKAFDLIETHVSIVRRIFRLAIDGYGLTAIAKMLNSEGVSSIGRKGQTWHQSYISLILQGRCVLGEYQPLTGNGVKAKPLGPMIPDYYPAVVSEEDFYKAQSAIRDRRRKPGRRGISEPNLFSNLIKCADDGSPMIITIKAKGSYATTAKRRQNPTGARLLVSSAASRGVPGSNYISFPYDRFEAGVLKWIAVCASDLSDEGMGESNVEIAALSGKVAQFDLKIRQMQTMIEETGEDIHPLLDVVASLARKRRDALSRMEVLKMETASSDAELLGEMESIVGLLETCSAEERNRLRSRLRSRIASLVSSISMSVAKSEYVGSRGRTFSGKTANILVVLLNGRRRRIWVNTYDRVTHCNVDGGDDKVSARSVELKH